MKSKSILLELLSIALENSEIYESEHYLEIEKNVAYLESNILEKISDNDLANYREARIDFETLFYEYGFIEGIKFLNEIIRTPAKELVSIDNYGLGQLKESGDK